MFARKKMFCPHCGIYEEQTKKSEVVAIKNWQVMHKSKYTYSILLFKSSQFWNALHKILSGGKKCL